MLGRKTAVGSAMMVGARLATRFIDLGTMLFLARLLDPTDFGIVAIAMGVVSMAEAALELPVNQALVRLPEISGRQYDTAFTLSLLRGLLLALLLAGAGWPLVAFYSDARLLPLILALSIAPIARGLVSPRLAGFQKELSFWRDFALELGGKLLAFALALAVANSGGGYWSIAAGAISFPLSVTVGSYILAPYRPRLTLAELHVFTGFVGWLSLAQIINAVNWQFERLLIGKLMLPSQLGLFTVSSDVASTPFLAFFGPVLRPLLAGFSQARDDRDRLRQSYLAASQTIVAFGLPILVGESLVSEPTVQLVLGVKWLSAAPLVSWLALSLIPALLALPAGPLVMSYGQTRLFVFRNAIELGVRLPVAILGTLQFGFGGVILARFLAEFIAGLYSVGVVKRLTGLTAVAQLAGSWRSAAASLAMVPAVSAVLAVVGGGPGMRLAAATLAGAGTYSAALWLFWTISGRPRGCEQAVASVIEAGLRRLLASPRAQRILGRGQQAARLGKL